MDAGERVRTRRAALVAGLVTALFLAVLFLIRPVPGAALALVGGPAGGVARYGGLVVRYRPPAGDRLAIEVPRVAEDGATRIADFITQGGIAFREVIEDVSLTRAPGVAPDRDRTGLQNLYADPGVLVALDSWRGELDDTQHADAYLTADSRAKLEAALARLHDAGWAPPVGTIVGFEHSRALPGRLSGRTYERWRTYWLADPPLVEGDVFASAAPSHDPNTGRPVVLIDFNPTGRAQFAAATRQVVGRQLAATIGREVMSAPVINGPITGGHAVITIGGGGDALSQDHEATSLAEVLRLVPPPAGGTIESQRWQPAPDLAAQTGYAIALIAVAGGLAIGVLVGLVLWFVAPSWQRRPAGGDGGVPWRRIAITLLAPVVLLVVREIPFAFSATDGLPRGMSPDRLSIGALGVRDVVTAFIVVELALMIWPRWRRARHRPELRASAGRAVALVALVSALVHGYFVMTTLSSFANPFADDTLIEPGLRAVVVNTLSLAAVTMLLIVIAGVINRRGLGNGYVALLVTEWVCRAAPLPNGETLGLSLDRMDFMQTAGYGLGVVTLIVIAIVTRALLRIRVARPGEVGLRVPSAGVEPLTMAATLLMIPTLISQIGVTADDLGWFAPVMRLWHAASDPWMAALTLAVLTVVWSYVFARPALLAPIAARGGLPAPSVASWWLATAMSVLGLLVIHTLSVLGAQTAEAARGLVGDAAVAMFVTAAVLDWRDELRIRRAGWTAVWALHQAQYAELVRRALGDAGIACELGSSHVRSLLCWFGPHVPIDVFVPPASAGDARRLLGAVFALDAATATARLVPARAAQPPG